MDDKVIIGIGGLIISVLSYFAGVIRTDLKYEKQERDSRIKNVFDKYMGFRKTNYTGGYDGLLKAGVATLKDDREIREVYTLIVKHAERPPLEIGKFDNIDLKAFFDFVIENKIDFLGISIEKILQRMVSKEKK